MEWSAISDAMNNVWGIVTKCVEFITGNAAMMALFVAGLIPIGFRIFRKARKSVR